MKTFLIIIGLILKLTWVGAQNKDSINPDLERLYWEYEVYNAKDSALKSKLLIDKALFFKSRQNYNEASLNLKRAIQINKKTSFTLQYEYALNLYLANRFTEAYNALIIIPDSLIHSKKDSQLLWLLTNIETQSLQICKSRIKGISDTTNSTWYNIDALPISYKYKSPEKAKKLSAIVPGLGQIYTGNPLKGITSLSLNIGALGLISYEVINGYYLGVTVFGFYPLLRFYNGGKTLSYNLAIRYNYKQEDKLKLMYKEALFKHMDSQPQ